MVLNGRKLSNLGVIVTADFTSMPPSKNSIDHLGQKQFIENEDIQNGD